MSGVPLPRALVTAGAIALEVGLGALFGALGIWASTSALGELKLRTALVGVGALALWCALLAGAVRLARAGRARARPGVTLCLIAFPALGIVAPVALQLAFTRGAGADPFSGWDGALATASQAGDPTSFFGAIIWGTIVPFVLVGVPLAARPGAPPWTTAALGACGGYLGFVATCELLVEVRPEVVLGLRHAFLVGLPCAVIGMGLVTRRSVRWRPASVVVAAVVPLIWIGLLGHSRHLVALLLRNPVRFSTFDEVAEHVDHRAWAEQLSHPTTAVREMVLTALESHGPRASTLAPALLRVVQQDADPRVRGRAVRVLGAAVADGPGDPEMWATLVDLSVDRDVWVSSAATSVIVRHAHPGPDEALEAAIVETKRSGPAEASDELLRLLVARWRRQDRLARDPQGVLSGVARVHEDLPSASAFLRSTFGAKPLEPLLRRALIGGDVEGRRLAARMLRESMDPRDLTADEMLRIKAALGP